MLDVAGLHVAYGAAPALVDLSLHVGPGELVCVVGPNGAGKTTLIHALAGILRAKAGRIAKDGEDLTRRAPHRWCAAGIAVVPEGRRLFTGMTVRENLEIGSYAARARAQRAVLLAQALALFPALEGRLDSLAGELSGGQQQMVAIARALMACPDVLLLDEPSLGLAPAIVSDLFDAIRRINGDGVSVLLVEQNVAIAMQAASRAYVLEEGRIVAEGPSHELMARPEIRRAYLGL